MTNIGRILLLAGLALSCATVDRERPADRPNVVLIVIDTLRADKLGCYGQAADTSPELDELSARGVRFDRVIAPSSWTRPSMGALLTSRHPRTLGIYSEEDDILADRFTTLAEILHQDGYLTVGVTTNPNTNSSFNFDQGFDRRLDSHVVFSFMNAGDTEDLYEDARLMSARDVFRAARELFAEGPRFPAYLELTLMETHEYRRFGRILTRPEFDGMFEEEKNPRYLRAVRQVSRDIATFVDELTAEPGWENTLFVITSDHGEGLLDHPDVQDAMGHGSVLYPSQVDVPLILYKPGWEPAVTTVTAPVSLLDVLPTVLDFVGIEAPAGIEGRSLKPLTRGPGNEVDLPATFVAETRFREANKIALYGPEWIYIENRDGWDGVNPHELQSLSVVPNGTRTDRIAEQAAVAEELARELRDWESDNPASEPTTGGRRLSDAEEEQLRAIGYIQ